MSSSSSAAICQGQAQSDCWGKTSSAHADVEYDLANGTMRLHSPNEDCKAVSLAYWAKSQPVVGSRFRGICAVHIYLRRLAAYASVNGMKMQVVFDTGASVSILSLQAAERIGLSPAAEGVVACRRRRAAWDRAKIPTWIGPCQELHARLMNRSPIRGCVSVIFRWSTDMLLGADFFLSHRLYFAKSQGKVYFT